MMNIKTLVIGASEKSHRYSNKAIRLLCKYNIEVEAIGLRKGIIESIIIQTGLPKLNDIHTICLYINPINQKKYYDYILNEIIPKRIIMNPGTENHELLDMAKDKGIEVLFSCTLVMLSTNSF